jgi:hypothetical protein
LGNALRRHPKVIGQKLLVNDYPMTIVGDPRKAYRHRPAAAAIRIPIQMKP